MQQKIDLKSLAGGIVYIKSVAVADLPDDIRAQAGDLAQIFSVHTENGEQLALISDRGMAFELARQHEMIPVAVH